MLGCECPSQQPVWEYEGDKYYRCPLLFIPDNIYDFIEQYIYLVEFPHTHHVGFNVADARWWEAWQAFKRYLQECEVELSRRESSSMPKVPGVNLNG